MLIFLLGAGRAEGEWPKSRNYDACTGYTAKGAVQEGGGQENRKAPILPLCAVFVVCDVKRLCNSVVLLFLTCDARTYLAQVFVVSKSQVNGMSGGYLT